MQSLFARFWKKASEFGLPEKISPDERKLQVSANQLMTVSMILIGSMIGLLIITWIFLLHLDFNFYRNYYWAGITLFVALFMSIGIFIYRGKTGRFYGPTVAFSYLMAILVAAITVIFGGYYGLENWILVVMGSSLFVLQKKPLQKRLAVFFSTITYGSLKLWIIYVPELLPVPHTQIRFIYYLLMSAAFFVIFFLEFRFISNQSARAEDDFIAQRDIADKLLLNIMPESVAHELKAKGSYEPRHYDAITVLFTDFVGFTKLASSMPPTKLLQSLDDAFRQFDQIVKKHGLEKLKTIGDAYMCASGIPDPVDDHIERACRAALEFRQVIEERKKITASSGLPSWDIRIGLHTGPVVAGIIGEHKFAYDIWGDTVNIASRMESSGEIGKVNVSAATANLIANKFALRARGLQAAKGLGEVEMFELLREK